MASIGYVRVSTQDQNLDLQHDAMASNGITKVFEDLGVSGAKADRPGLQAALDYCREGDVFTVWRLDRLGRNLTHVRATIEALTERGVVFKSLSEGITSEGIMGKLMISILAAFSEFERDVMIERTQAGIKAARLRGSTGGRPPKLTPKQVERARKLKDDGTATVPEIAAMLDCSVPTLYRALSGKKVSA